MSFKMDRKQYSDMFGVTLGDSIRLADTEIFIQIEKDLTIHGDECKFGGGKSLRTGMGLNPNETRANKKVVDTIITNAVILDYTGIIKADIGIKNGKIAFIGKGGNPQNMDHVDFIVGASTEVIAGEGCIITAGGIDSHVHFVSHELPETALNGGITTLIGGGTGLAEGSKAVTTTPGAWHIQKMLESAEGFPVNLGFFGKGSGYELEVNAEQIKAGAIGLKVHEDWGATYSAINKSLECAEIYDVQVAIHTDTLNEGGFVQNTIKSFKDRVVHAFHSEGAGGGHAPDIIKVAELKNVIPASTNPTKPYTINTIAEHLDMLMVCHHLDPKVPEDIAFADSRIRPQTIAAEDILHDLGALSIMSSDAQAMGRIAEVVSRTWQTAHKMKIQRGSLENDSKFNDNTRAKRYIAKYTINPAIVSGVSDYIGSVEVGKFADLVIWTTDFFAVKPKMVLKCGAIVHGIIGDANASIPTPEPQMLKNGFGAYGKSVQKTSITFVSTYAYENAIKEKLGLEKIVLPVKNTRKIGKKDMKFNDATPTIEVDPQTYDVKVDGKKITCDPLDVLPMAQRYFLY